MRSSIIKNSKWLSIRVVHRSSHSLLRWVRWLTMTLSLFDYKFIVLIIRMYLILDMTNRGHLQAHPTQRAHLLYNDYNLIETIVIMSWMSDVVSSTSSNQFPMAFWTYVTKTVTSPALARLSYWIALSRIFIIFVRITYITMILYFPCCR